MFHGLFRLVIISIHLVIHRLLTQIKQVKKTNMIINLIVDHVFFFIDFTNASDLEIIARRHNFEPLISVNERPVLKKPPLSDSHSQWMNSGVLFTDKTIEPSSDIQASKTGLNNFQKKPQFSILII